MVRFGRGIRALRRRRAWTQTELAERAGVSQSQVARIELGKGERVMPAVLERIALQLGARVHLRLDWNGEALDRLLDRDHAALVEFVVATLRGCGWEVAVESTFAIRGERGSIDVLAWHDPTHTLLVVEVKSVVPDVQATLFGLKRKVRLAAQIAAPRGWRPVVVATLLVVAESDTARRRVHAHAATFEAELPDRNVAVRRYLAAPTPGRPLRGLWFASNSRAVTTRARLRIRSGRP